MKIQLSVSEKYYKEIEERLLKAEFEIDENGPFLLSEKEQFASILLLKDDKGEKVRIYTAQITFIESFGHTVMVHTEHGESYLAAERLYQLEALLDDSKFIRVSNCAIVAKDKIKKIRPALSMKFVLTMTDGALVDVTRSYYSSFKKFLGI